MAEQSWPFAGTPSAANPEGTVQNEAKLHEMQSWWRETGILDGLTVRPATSTLAVVVESGKAVIDGVYYQNTAGVVFPVTLPGTGSRWDRVFLRLDRPGKRVYARYATGSATAAPPPVNTATIYEWTMATFQVAAGQARVPDFALPTDRFSPGGRTDRGPSWCLGLAHGQAIPANINTRLGLNDSGADLYREGVDAAGSVGQGKVTILRDGVYSLSINGRIDNGTEYVNNNPVRSIFLEVMRLTTRLHRIGTGGGATSTGGSGVVRLREGDAVVPYAVRDAAAGTWRIVDTADESRFSGAWLRP